MRFTYITLAAFALLSTEARPWYAWWQDKKEGDPGPCCKVCSEADGFIKTYSIDHVFNHCGESCIQPTDFWKYKIFEPGLTKCDHVNDTPCADHGYTNYTETETHGFPHVLTVQLDFYDQPKNETEGSNNFLE